MNRSRQKTPRGKKPAGGGKTKPCPPKGPPVNVAKRPIPPIKPIPEEEETVHEIQPEEPKQETKKDSWLDHLPPVIKPDEELHQQLSKERKRQHAEKVTKICKCELDGIFNYAFDFLKNINDDDSYPETRKYRSTRVKFRNGFFTPEVSCPSPNRESLATVIYPSHSLAIQYYLHFKSHSYLSDLSCAFGVTVSDKKLEDPNPLFNSFIQKLHNSSQTFINSYHPYDTLQFPFIVGIGGPAGSGRTTIAQFLQKSFDAHLLDVKPTFPEGGKKGKKTTQPIENNEITEYPLPNSILIRYSDDKNAVQQLIDTIKENMDGKGFIIIGYPNNKNQYTALEKELGKQNLNMHEYQINPDAPPLSQRQKAALPNIDGVIIALNNEEDRQRMIDPETGNVYKPGFYMPGLPDLIGVLPSRFLDTKMMIESRLIEVTVPEITIIPSKSMNVYNQFEALVKKNAASTIIKHCDDIMQFLTLLDNFLDVLFKKLPNLIPKSPMTTLIHPTCLIMPELCFNAVTTWYKCIEHFGKTIADQSGLISTFDTKIDLIIKSATERYQLLIGQKDDRSKLCEEFMKNPQNNNLSQHFRLIWDMSLKIRNKNLESVDDVVGRSGLVELLLELRKSPKIVFIALVQRMLYVKWFDETFKYIDSINIDEETDSHFFRDLSVENTEIPHYTVHSSTPKNDISLFKSNPEFSTKNNEIPTLDLQFALSSENLPQSAKAVRPPDTSSLPQSPRVPLTSRRTEDQQKKERRIMASIRGFDYLVENLNYFCEKPQDNLYFDCNKACTGLDVIPTEIKTSFDDTSLYAEEFFNYVSQHSDSQLLVNEAKSSLTIFQRFMKLCKTKEASMVNSVFDLRDSLNNYTYAKCTHEMEYFARQFRELKQGHTNITSLFEYDLGHMNESIRRLGEFALQLKIPIIAQEIINTNSIMEIAKEACNRNFLSASGDDLMQIAQEIGVFNDDELNTFEYCMKVSECVEHFDVLQFLLSLVSDRDDEIELMKMFRNVTPVESTENLLDNPQDYNNDNLNGNINLNEVCEEEEVNENVQQDENENENENVDTNQTENSENENVEI